MAANSDRPRQDHGLSDDTATDHTHQQQDGFFEPEPRADACGAVVEGKFILHRGLQESFKDLNPKNFLRVSEVDAFDPSLLAWETRQTTGPNPQAVHGSACTCIGHILYIFAGHTETLFTNELHALNTLSSVWKQHHPRNPSEGPMRKFRCGMIAIDDSTLAIVAGRGIPSGDIQPGSRFVKNTEYSDGEGWTNELHKYDLNNDLWSSPTTSGEPPPPCNGFTFTKVDLLRAVMVGGFQGDIWGRVSTAFVLNFIDWVWSRLLPKGPYQLPPRDNHTAFSLHDPASNPAHPAVVISCGMDNRGNPLRDMCILRVTDGSCEEIPLPPSFIARYFHTGGVFYISPGKLKLVHFGGYPEKYDVTKSWSEQAFTAHTTVVELERAEGREGSVAGWIPTVKNPRVEAIYSEALQHGYSEDRPTVVLLTGAAGSGKSHVRCLLLNLPPPPIRHSTPLAETPVRAISASTAVASGDSFHEVKDEEEDQLLAHSVASGVCVRDSNSPPAVASFLVEERSQSSQPGEQEIHSVSQNQPQASPPAPEPVGIEQPATQPETQQPDRTLDTCPPTNDHTNLDSDSPDESTIQSDASVVVAQLGDEVKALLNPGSKSNSAVPQGDSIYIVDSGGQPQYPHIFPLLMQPPLVTLHVTNLSERLDQHPVVEYYKQGKAIGRSISSPFTNEQLIMHSARGVQSRSQKLTSTDASPTTKLVIVGTHRDKEGVFSESRAKKNARITERLCPHVKQNLVFCGRTLQSPIFPLNAKSPDDRDRRVMQQVRRAINSARDSVESIKTPTAWHVLKKGLHKLASTKGRLVLSKQECLEVAVGVHMDAERLEVALCHLAGLALIHYFPEVLPEVVFCKSQVLLDKVTEIVECWYQLYSSSDSTAATDATIVPFQKEGMITCELLARFPEHYVHEGNIFTPAHFLHLMKRRHLVAKVSDLHYFMPAILLELPGAELEKHRVPSSSPVAPLAIYFEDGIPPCGLFCSVVSTLLSSGELELARDPKSLLHPKLVASNCVWFLMPHRLPGEVVFIDAFSHYEVHVHSKIIFKGDAYFNLRSCVLQAMSSLADNIDSFNIAAQTGFVCDSRAHLQLQSLLKRLFSAEEPVSHVATVSSDGCSHYWTCSRNPSEVNGPLEDKHLVWNPLSQPVVPASVPQHAASAQVQPPSQSVAAAVHAQVGAVSSAPAPVPVSVPQSSPDDQEPTPLLAAAVSEDAHSVLDEAPTPGECTAIRWRDERGRLQRYRLCEAVSYQWRKLGQTFGFPEGFLRNVAATKREEPEACWDSVVSRWLQDGSEPLEAYPTTWQGLSAALENVGGFRMEIKKLHRALNNRCCGD